MASDNQSIVCADSRKALPEGSAPEVTDPIRPRHYQRHPSGVECIDVAEHFGFNLGNTIKYIWRADEKGDPVTDLRKALWYLRREIARREGKEGR